MTKWSKIKRYSLVPENSELLKADKVLQHYAHNLRTLVLNCALDDREKRYGLEQKKSIANV